MDMNKRGRPAGRAIEADRTDAGRVERNFGGSAQGVETVIALDAKAGGCRKLDMGKQTRRGFAP